MDDEKAIVAPDTSAVRELESQPDALDLPVPGIAIEHVPDNAILFMRVHDQHIDKNGKLRPGVFRNQGDGMSTDWSKYSTAEETRIRARNPVENGVLSLGAGAVRGIHLVVQHTPHNAEPPHARHVDVIGEKTEEVRMRLLDVFYWEIKNRRAV